MGEGTEVGSQFVMDTTTQWLDFLVKVSESVPSAIIGSAVGAGFAMWFTINLNRQEHRRRLTQEFIDEMLSADFLKHRIALSSLREEFDANSDLIGRFAQGFWYPGGDNEYLGEEYAEFNSHQHFEASIGWVRRLAHAVRNGRVNEEDIKTALSDAYKWMDATMYPVAKEVSRQIEDTLKVGTKVGATRWLRDVYELSEFFGLHES